MNGETDRVTATGKIPEGPSALPSKTFGPVSFVAALVNIALVAVPAILLPLMMFWGAPFIVGFAIIDLVASSALSFFGGRAGQVGKGMLIGWLALPASAVVLGAGIAIAHAIGPI